MASLWRTQRPRFPQYISDGSGRDYYIKYNNAGYWEHQFKLIKKPEYEYPKYKNFHSLFHQAAPFKYIPTGNGRETYIINNVNGFYHEQKPLASYKLDDFLREEQNIEKTKKFKLRKHYMSLGEKKYNNQLKNLEKQLINRLYNIALKNKKKNKEEDENGAKKENENILPNIDIKKEGENNETEKNIEGKFNTIDSLPSSSHSYNLKFNYINGAKKKKMHKMNKISLKNNFNAILKQSEQLENYEMKNFSRRSHNETDYNIYKDGRIGCRMKKLVNCQSENWKYRLNTEGNAIYNTKRNYCNNVKTLKKNKLTFSYENDFEKRRFNTLEY